MGSLLAGPTPLCIFECPMVGRPQLERAAASEATPKRPGRGGRGQGAEASLLPDDLDACRLRLTRNGRSIGRLGVPARRTITCKDTSTRAKGHWDCLAVARWRRAGADSDTATDAATVWRMPGLRGMAAGDWAARCAGWKVVERRGCGAAPCFATGASTSRC